MVTIDVYDASITYQSKGAWGRLEAEEGFSIKCVFTIKNTTSDTKKIWWAIHDHEADKRLESGTSTLSPGSTIGVLRYITMPDHDIHIKYWSGTVGDDGKWYSSDHADMPKIYLKAPPAPTVGYVNVRATVSGAPDVSGAEITVDGEGTGVYTPGTAEVSTGYHLIGAKKAGYISGMAQGRYIGAGSTYDVSVSLMPEILLCGITPTISPPSSLSLKPPATGVMPDLGSVPSLPVGIVFTPSCLKAGSPVAAPSNLFPFGEDEVVVTIDDIEVTPVSIPSTGSTIDLQSTIKAMISNGLITTDTDSISLKIWYPKTIQFQIFDETRTVTEYATYSKNIPVSIPKPIICGITPTISPPDSLPLTPPATGVMPDLGSVPSLPVGIVFTPSCLKAGSPVAAPSNLFPFGEDEVVVTIDDIEVTTGSIPSTGSTIDLQSTIKAMISNGLITTDTDSISLKIWYPKTIKFPEAGGAGTVTEYTTYSKNIPVSMAAVAEILCDIAGTLSDIPSIPITIPASGLPSLGTGSIPVNLSLSSVCNKNGSSVATPADMFSSLSAEVFIDSTKIPDIYPNSAGTASFDLASFASTLLSGVTGSTSKTLTVRYPSSVKIGSVTVLGTTDITKTITLSLGAAPPPGCTEGTFMSPFTCPDGSVIYLLKCVDSKWVSSGQSCPPAGGVEELLCTITGTLSDIPSIPITIPASGSPSLGTGSIPVNLSLSSVCNKNGSSVATPADMFSSLSAEVFIGSTKVGNIYPNSSGLASFDLASFASTLLSGVTGSTSKILTVRYPSSVKIGSVTVLGTTDITKTITLSAGAAPPPGCTEGALMSPFTCPDGSVIYLLKCVDGKWVSSGQSCPPAPGCTEGALMSPFTCPDGSVIYLSKCVDGKWVSSGQSCPPAPECTEGALKDPFTCPDGTMIYMSKCVDGKWGSSGQTCPPAPECTEGTFKDLFTCPDGTMIYMSKCVDGKWGSSGQTCPPAPKLETKMVYVIAPMLTRVGKKITIVAKVYCGTKPSGGEKTWITVNGGLLTTTNTRGGEATASYTPVEPGIYSICATVPESSACNASGSSCTTIQVVEELSAPEIEAAEEEFEKSKERIGEIMERI